MLVDLVSFAAVAITFTMFGWIIRDIQAQREQEKS